MYPLKKYSSFVEVQKNVTSNIGSLWHVIASTRGWCKVVISGCTYQKPFPILTKSRLDELPQNFKLIFFSVNDTDLKKARTSFEKLGRKTKLVNHYKFKEGMIKFNMDLVLIQSARERL